MECLELNQLIADFRQAKKAHLEAQSYATFQIMMHASDELCAHTGLNEVQVIEMLKDLESKK